MVGQRAKVIKILQKNNVGEVKRSGTIMKAILSEDNLTKEVKDGENVEIVSVDGNILIVTNNDNHRK